MVDENVARQLVFPASCRGPQTKVIFLAVSFTECLRVEKSGFFQALAADVHTEPDGRRDFDRTAGVHHGKGGIEFREAGERPEVVIYTEVRIATNGGVIGERRDGAGSDRKSTRLNSSHLGISYAVLFLKKTLADNQRVLRGLLSRPLELYLDAGRTP